MSFALCSKLAAKYDSEFIYLFGFYFTFNTVQVISRWVVGRAEETSTYSSSGFCTVNCQPTASNYHLSDLRSSREPNTGLRGCRRECYHSATVAPNMTLKSLVLTHIICCTVLIWVRFIWVFFVVIYVKLMIFLVSLFCVHKWLLPQFLYSLLSLLHVDSPIY